MVEAWLGDSKIYIKIKSTSHPNQFKLCEISDSGARCLGLEEITDVTTDTDNIIECPACKYGKKCIRCRKIEAAIGVGVYAND
jgi:hypothetical protein